MNRRDFLKGIAACAVSLVLPKPKDEMIAEADEGVGESHSGYTLYDGCNDSIDMYTSDTRRYDAWISSKEPIMWMTLDGKDICTWEPTGIITWEGVAYNPKHIGDTT